ncbi:MAG: dienelactone hydrolase-like enzyme [Gammaproteobacteria bacterium]|jgi:dienelactone hydrolase|nr:dienelactone hydrolase-like enzyme [Gammaproteobacteria bacterium]
MTPAKACSVTIANHEARLAADLTIPEKTKGLVIFAHGSGSSRHSSRNQWVAKNLNQAGIATLLLDLLTDEEEFIDRDTACYRFNIPLLAKRLLVATQWAKTELATRQLAIGYFGASTGAGAALIAAAELPTDIRAVVARGGRPDLAGNALAKVKAPVLLIVGGNDDTVIELNQQAQKQMCTISKLEIVPGATHLFSEPGTLERVADSAQAWFLQYL